jgi:hypothetical protein
LAQVRHIVVAGNAALLAAVKAARHGFLAPYLDPSHVCTGTLYTPMQCMLKEVCASCLHRQVDPATGREKFVYACTDTQQILDWVDLDNFGGRLGANSMAQKQTNLWLDGLLMQRA